MKAFPVLSHANAANGITSLSILASLTAICLAMDNRLPTALVVGAITLPCDVLDGFVARRRKTVSGFGAQLDSLSDAIGFGVLPAVLGYAMGVQGVGTAALAVYALGAVWRLARFGEVGVTQGWDGRSVFEGMPTTFAAALFYVIAAVAVRMPTPAGNVTLTIFFASGAILMNGRFAFPKTGWHTRLLWALVPAALITVLFREW